MAQTDTRHGLPAEDDWDLPFVIEGVISFCEFLADTTFYPYQRPFAYRIIESVLIEDAAHLTALFARQSGKSETVCNTVAGLMILLPRLARIYPERLGKFKSGFWVGLFAPVDDQADTLYGRLVDRLTSERAQEILEDPEIDDVVPKSVSRRIRLQKSKSFCMKMTANPKAKIESKTFHLVVIDEAQDCDDYVISKSIMPMLAATAGTSVRTGTPNTRKSEFLTAIRMNKNRAAALRGSRQDHFEADWKEVGRFNPRYKKYVEQERERLTEESAEFQMSYCVAPETRILTADLRHVRADEITVGQRLVGFDEDRPGKGKHRRFRTAEVEAVGSIVRPCYRITLDDGTSVVSSAEHMWLAPARNSRASEWRTTQDMRIGDQFFKVTGVWEARRSYESGYLAGAFNGEGCLSASVSGQLDISFAQKNNSMLQVKEYLAAAGFGYREASYEGSRGVHKLTVAGSRADGLRFLGEIRPERLLAKLDIDRLGSIARRQHQTDDFSHPRVVSIAYVGEMEVVAIRTTTRTFVAEGLASHNCLRWMLDRGMFTTEERMDALGDVQMQDLVKAWTRTAVCVGIDPARSTDSTIVTVVWVDWDLPDEFGLYEHRVLNWLEIQNMPLEQQYPRIVQFLEPYALYAVAVDNQGMGLAVAERLAVLLRHKNCDVVPMNSNPSDQNKRWKHLTTLMDRGLIHWPAGARVRRLKTWQRFFHQMTNVETKMQGPNLLVKAPEEAGAHDDYPDSLALACALTAELAAPVVEVIDAPWFR